MRTGNDGGPNGSFERRLRLAREKQGLDRSPADDSAGALPTSAMGIGLRVGTELLAALAVAVLIGWWLDRWLHTSPVLLGAFVLLGGAAGVANVYRLMGPKAAARAARKDGGIGG